MHDVLSVIIPLLAPIVTNVTTCCCSLSTHPLLPATHMLYYWLIQHCNLSMVQLLVQTAALHCWLPTANLQFAVLIGISMLLLMVGLSKAICKWHPLLSLHLLALLDLVPACLPRWCIECHGMRCCYSHFSFHIQL